MLTREQAEEIKMLVAEHAKTKHADLAYHPRFSFREGTSKSGLIIPMFFTCETCDEKKVQADNSIRVTCLEDI